MAKQVLMVVVMLLVLLEVCTGQFFRGGRYGKRSQGGKELPHATPEDKVGLVLPVPKRN
ncbi:hypothetical protein RvY_02186 [Ramazzottius varieornatus]|uniref:Uncharacterized protein n=1 Tax=Ramazzottius varieornatus TaxID=947166 RepID=A0A1D1UIW1_RAMVA|nr:hypothetical protein RvY_02186 [Ramazzottius varieornatus]